MKKDYLAVYDYGMGGIWVVIHAGTKEEIIKMFPELTIVDDRPGWMTTDHYNKIKSEMYMDIDEKPSGWFAGLIKNRNQS